MNILCAATDDTTVAPMMKVILSQEFPQANIRLAFLISEPRDQRLCPVHEDVLGYFYRQNKSLFHQISDYCSNHIASYNLDDYDHVVCATEDEGAYVQHIYRISKVIILGVDNFPLECGWDQYNKYLTRLEIAIKRNRNKFRKTTT